MDIKIDPNTQTTIMSDTVTFPTVIVYPHGLPASPPSACPGCGRCKDCGQPFAAPVAPLPSYPMYPWHPAVGPLYVGTPVWGFGEVTCAPFLGTVLS